MRYSEPLAFKVPGSIGGTEPLVLSEQNHHAASSEAIQTLFKRCFPDRVVHDVDSGAPSDAFHFLFEVVARITDDVVCAGVTGQSSFRFR